jgi:hypothetical protein
MFDSHILWKEPFPLLALMAYNSKTLRLGTCVTNPAARNLYQRQAVRYTGSDLRRRMKIGIGRGDSSRRIWASSHDVLSTRDSVRVEAPAFANDHRTAVVRNALAQRELF